MFLLLARWSMISARFFFISSTDNPRRPSFAPSATISTRTSPSSAQSSRRSPPADVSPGHAGVDHLELVAVGVDLLLEQRRVCLGLEQTEARRQTVAESDDPGALRGSAPRSSPAGAASCWLRRCVGGVPAAATATEQQAATQRQPRGASMTSRSSGVRGLQRPPVEASCSSSAAIACSSICRCAGAVARSRSGIGPGPRQLEEGLAVRWSRLLLRCQRGTQTFLSALPPPVELRRTSNQIPLPFLDFSPSQGCRDGMRLAHPDLHARPQGDRPHRRHRRHPPRRNAVQGSLQPLFAQITEAADMLVLCGDLTDYGLPDEARALAREITSAVKIPCVGVSR